MFEARRGKKAADPGRHASARWRAERDESVLEVRRDLDRMDTAHPSAPATGGA
ncbi:MAG: hypothetical protein ACYDHU_10110 [Acidimicrobiales bacterium]